MNARVLTVTLVATLSHPPILDAQEPGTGDAFLDETARALVVAARQRRQQIDASLLSYTAVVRHRIGVGLRTLRKDRTIYRAETASRVRWSRDEPTVVQVLAGRQEHPGGVEAEVLTDDVFDPTQDPIFFGLSDDQDEEFFVQHPLRDGSELHYQYRSGDTLRISFPDGRVVEAVEIQILPRQASFKLISGSLWIDPASGGLVRAAYRLSRNLDVERDWDLILEESDDPDLAEAEEGLSKVPGIFKPIQMELRLVAVEYSLWNFRYWLPRVLRAEGEARAGIIRAPAAFEITYEIEDAYGEEEREQRIAAGELASAWDVLDAWDQEGDYDIRITRRQNRGSTRRLRVLVPNDEQLLTQSPELPPPIWEDIGPSISEVELEEMFEGLADLPQPTSSSRAWSFQWGYQGADLLRYNRVEGLSVGARLEKSFGSLSTRATLRLGTADLTPDVSLELFRDRLTSRLALSGYYSLAPVDELGQALDIGNSANALIFGRDDGEYFRAVGGTFEWVPPSGDRLWYSWRFYAERHQSVEGNTDVALPGLWRSPVFRPNIEADEATQIGSALRISPWWGTYRSSLQGGLDWFAQGAFGDFEYARTKLVGSVVFPLFERVRGALEAGAGTSWGEVPVQRLWYMGGGPTLRGYDGSSLVGTSFLRSRVELSRGIQAVGLAVFSDWAWAGEKGDFDAAEGLWSAGAGATFLDGLFRIDVTRALRAPTGWRLELRLDSLL